MEKYPQDDSYEAPQESPDTDETADADFIRAHHLNKEAIVATSALGMLAVIGVVAARRLAKKKTEGDS